LGLGSWGEDDGSDNYYDDPEYGDDADVDVDIDTEDTMMKMKLQFL